MTEAPRNRLQLHELANVAGVLTVARAPIALAFLFVADQPGPSMALYLAGLATDVVDGLVARRTGTTSYTGAMVDGYMDKFMHAVVSLALAWHGLMPAWWLLLWFAREWVLLGMVIAYTGAYRRGEFKPVDVPSAVLSLVLPMVMLCLHKHSLAACMPSEELTDPHEFIRRHIELVLGGLLVGPRTEPRRKARR